MKLFTQGFKQNHLFILLGFVLVFSALTGWAMYHQRPDDWRENQNIAATLLTISGPFTGAIARPTQADCWNFSWKIFPYCAAVLLLGIFCQVVRLPLKHGAMVFRISLWIFGLLGWFAGAILSLLYALS